MIIYLKKGHIIKAQIGTKTAPVAVGGDKSFGIKKKGIGGGDVVGGVDVSAPKYGDRTNMGKAYYNSMGKIAGKTKRAGMDPKKLAAIRAQEANAGRNLTDDQIIAEYGHMEFAGERQPLNMGVASKYASTRYNEQDGLWEVTTNPGAMLPNAGEYLQRLNPNQRYRVDGKGGMVYNKGVAAARARAASNKMAVRRSGGIMYKVSD